MMAGVSLGNMTELIIQELATKNILAFFQCLHWGIDMLKIHDFINNRIHNAVQLA